VANLIANSPFGELLPLQVGRCDLSELVVGPITSISVQKGQEKAVSAQLKKTHGLGFPAANRATAKGDTRCIWVGPGQALLLGKAPKAIKGATRTDQSDGWAVMRLEGSDAEAALARLVPVDRASVFKTGHAAKTLLFHMPLSVIRSSTTAFDLMVFRSMAQSAVHDLSQAMKSVAALSR